MPVHPRWRGEHMPNLNDKRATGGSSPLARGTLVEVGGLTLGCRFIPAGAGNTCWLGLSVASFSVHPRWRGEHVRDTGTEGHWAGSSPLARGTLPCLGRLIVTMRFIPAGAGNTRRCPTFRRPSSVHPRWRGEHDMTGGAGSTVDGSSPLARGTHYPARISNTGGRFIPAGAGNTRSGYV